MFNKRDERLMLDHVRIILTNFAGRETDKNRAGERNFCAVIDDPDLADRLRRDGWNIKQFDPREDGDEPTYFVQVRINYKSDNPPKIFRVGSDGRKKLLTEDTVANLDGEDIRYADIVINPYHWTMNGKTGIKAYLKKMHAIIDEDEFDARYAEEEYPSD